ncbi:MULTISPECIES: serine hydrolase [unclassified Streptomyces]|uniref:serine hydrolase n=1 Tax=unclassified Streptomyces TaxID=2593676 RepID=UPI0009391C3D|nr:serine hydrolase [Streptomyces sp. TSRI0281]OKI31765.1 hypothetical protein A6A29_24350 [Streptomyces sp. TSRI0281]
MSRQRLRRRSTRSAPAAAAVKTVVSATVPPACSTAGGAYPVGRAPDTSPGAVASVSSASPPATRAPAAARGEEAEVDLDAELARVVAPLIGDARLSVAVLDTGRGAGAVYGDGAAYDTASIVKVDILAALLLRAQDEGRELSDAEQTYAASMIGRSDDASATRLWRVIGGAEGLDAANVRLGLTGTAAARAWGLTQTTAADQVRLLRAVFDGDGDGDSAQGSVEGSVLSRASRVYVRGLMGRVEADQRWGVSAAGDAWALKNGWMPRTTTGLWDINSIGRVRAGGRDYLVAVLCDGQPTKEAGITLVEAVAKAAVGVVSDAR